mgnify:CR=1 FL=1
MILKPISEINPSDIEALAENKVAEGPSLEYKSKLPGGSDSEKIRFLAEISAFANTRGGVLLAGISDVEGVPDKICGIECNDLDSELLRIEQIIRNGLSPSIKCTLKPFVVDEKKVLVIEVGKSWKGPHMVSFKDHSKFYGRNSAGKFPMDVYEIRDAFLSSETIPERVRRFRQDRVNKIHNRDELPIELANESMLAIHVVPMAAFGVGGGEIISNETMSRCLLPPLGASGWNDRINLDGVVSFTGRFGESSRSYTQLFRNGAIEAVASVGMKVEDGTNYINGSGIEQYLVKGLGSYINFYGGNDVPGPYYCFITLIDVLGATMAMERSQLGFGDKPISDRSILLIPEAVIDSPSENLTKILTPKINMMWNAFGIIKSPNLKYPS